MTSKWEDSTLGDILMLQRGMDLPVQERKGGKHPIVASNGVVGFHDEAPVKAPGVVIGRSGSIGGGQFIEQDFWPLNTTLWVKDFKGNDSRFCYYLLKSIDFSSMNAGSGVPTLNRNHLHPMRVAKPPVSVQKSISGMLGSLDDRITLLRETNQTLEAIAQALFKSWFVDFDPVRAKSQGNLPVGMGEPTAALFPDAFKETELGMVPKGWVVGRLMDFAKLKGGKMLGKEHFSVSSKFPVYGGAGEMGRSNLSNAEGFVITVGRVGAYCGQYFWHSGKAWVNNNASHVIPYNVNYSVWLYQWLCSVDMNLIKKGAAQPFVSNTDIENLQIILPAASVIEEFVNVCEPLFMRMASALTSISTLTNLRDILLPRLISGQLRIADAEAETEKASA
jgi:type I restriction enzyme S subunit